MKILLTILLSFCISTLIFTQNVPIDFEPGGNGADWIWTVFENDTDPPLEIVDNPDMSGQNTSGTVAKFTALQTGQPFAGVETMHGAGIGTFTVTSATSVIRIMVWKSVISDVGIKLVDATSFSLGEIKVANTVVNEWEELTFDFSDHVGNVYDQIVIFPDFNARTSDQIVYFDNIDFSPEVPIEVPMVAAPDPTIDPANVISMFSGVYTDVPVDTWQTVWSQGVLNDIQIDNNDTKQYVDLNFVGVETTGPNILDVSGMNFFHLDFWTPNMTVFRVKLVDFGADGSFGGGDDSEHEIIFDNPQKNTWISYTIPMADFAGLASQSHMAQLIFSGMPVGEGVAYIDNVFYSNDAPSSVNELQPFSFELFPNPARDNLTITSDEKIDRLEVCNNLGIVVQSQTPVSGNISLNTAELSAGLYFVKATIGEQTLVKRFVKK